MMNNDLKDELERREMFCKTGDTSEHYKKIQEEMHRIGMLIRANNPIAKAHAKFLRDDTISGKVLLEFINEENLEVFIDKINKL